MRKRARAGIESAKDVLLERGGEELLRQIGSGVRVELPLESQVLVDRLPVGLDHRGKRQPPRFVVVTSRALDNREPGRRKIHTAGVGTCRSRPAAPRASRSTKLLQMSAESAAKEWNAASYHRVSGPQTEWGRRVLSRLQVRGDERVIDAGCGTGRLTSELMHLVAAGPPRCDRSIVEHAADGARKSASGVRRSRVVSPASNSRCCRSTAGRIWYSAPPRSTGCAITSDSSTRSCDRFDREDDCSHSVAAARTSHEAHALAEDVMRRAPFADIFAIGRACGSFRRLRTSAARLESRQASWTSRPASSPRPTTLVDEASYREFVTTVIYNPHLAWLPEGPLRAQFIDEVTALAARQDPPYHARLLAAQPRRNASVNHPTVVRPAEHAVYSPEKMGKSTIFESPRCSSASTLSSRVRHMRCTRMPARTRCTQSSRVRGSSC